MKLIENMLILKNMIQKIKLYLMEIKQNLDIKKAIKFCTKIIILKY